MVAIMRKTTRKAPIAIGARDGAVKFASALRGMSSAAWSCAAQRTLYGNAATSTRDHTLTTHHAHIVPPIRPDSAAQKKGKGEAPGAANRLPRRGRRLPSDLTRV